MNKGQKENRSYTQVKRIRVKEGSKTNARPEKIITFRVHPSIHTTRPIHRNLSCHRTKGNPRQAASLAQGYQIDTDNYSHLLPIYNHHLTEHTCLWAVEGSWSTQRQNIQDQRQHANFTQKSRSKLAGSNQKWEKLDTRQDLFDATMRVEADITRYKVEPAQAGKHWGHYNIKNKTENKS